MQEQWDESSRGIPFQHLDHLLGSLQSPEIKGSVIVISSHGQRPTRGIRGETPSSPLGSVGFRCEICGDIITMHRYVSTP